ncbi:hypothetical protein G3163_004717, partial [Salmonella enterica subsp. enterica serovar Javiana]|nr:hypothetical protein [Salmonella enterica subsp. enterica serovar Javiana]
YCAQLHRLTQGEQTIILDIVQGKSPTEIAYDRDISPKTISTQKRKAFMKMQVSSDVDCIHYLYFLKSEMKHFYIAENSLREFRMMYPRMGIIREIDE